MRDGGLRVSITSHHASEPPHIRVDDQGASAKFWLKPVRCLHHRVLGPGIAGHRFGPYS
ncbi:MAG TPA: DUF4160 domain-containing protein [Thermoanaerobaculia bacterium]|nr:DUF4160 domain-containing protein [Thermoanaerobaculia bacterium]